MTPAGEPADDLGDRLAQRRQAGSDDTGNLLWRRETVRPWVKMHIAAHLFIFQRNKALADKHLSNADSKKQPILIHSTSAECGLVKRVGDECVAEHCNAIL